MSRRLTILCSCLLWLALPAKAQQAPAPQDLLRPWLTAQGDAAQRLTYVEVREDAVWTVDGPFGLRRTEVASTVTGGPATDGWQRLFLSVVVNDEAIAPARWQEVDRQRRSMLGANMQPMIRSLFQLPQLLRSMRPTGSVQEEQLDDGLYWRLEMIPRLENRPVERVTLWFTQQGQRLHRSRVLVQPRNGQPPILLTTDYTRLEGLDVPMDRRLEGTAQTRRRMRTFTLLFVYTATYSDYRLSTEGAG